MSVPHSSTPNRPALGTTVSWRMGHNGELRSGVVVATAENARGTIVKLDKPVSPFERETWISMDCLIEYAAPPSAAESESASWQPPFRYSGD